MNVEQYLFQSPSPQRVQVGRPDTSTTKEETETETKAQESSKPVEQTQDLSLQEPEKMNLTSPNRILDLYV